MTVNETDRGAETASGPDSTGSQDAMPTPASARGGRRRVGPAVAVAVGALLVALLAFGVIVQSPSTGIDDSLAKGRPAPAPPFALAVLQHGNLGSALAGRLEPALRDGRLEIRELRGIPVVLNIWASWCDPCKEEAPILERAWRTEGRPRGTLFLGLDQQDVTSDGRAFLRSYGLDYLNVRDPGNDVPLRYGATGVPETYFISARGDVVDHVIGVVSPRDLRAGITAARTGRPLQAQTAGAHRASR